MVQTQRNLVETSHKIALSFSMNILIFGNGYIANRMKQAWPDALISEVRIDDRAAVAHVLDEVKPDAVINTAGKTGKPNVDWCEANQETTYRSNVVGALTLAEECRTRNIYLLHLGSGCIFYGPSPDPKGWTEEDFANPLAFYSRTKYAADLILSKLPGVGVARLRMPIDWIPNSRNLIDKLTAYPKVIDVENSVTVVEDLLSAARQLMEKKGEGIFHVVNEGTMRHKDLIALYEQYVDPTHKNEWINDEDLVKLGLATKQRSNCILQSPRLAALGIKMRPIKEALEDTMKRYAEKKQKQ